MEKFKQYFLKTVAALLSFVAISSYVAPNWKCTLLIDVSIVSRYWGYKKKLQY